MVIGNLQLANNTILAPLAGITNLPFRLLAKEAGCAMVCSEMISANGLVHRSLKTLAMLDSVPAERPLSVQIFGSDPEVMAEAAQSVQEAGADVLDVNFGCAVRKIIKTGAGAALMQMPQKAEALLKAMRRAVQIPLTIKIRSGWDASGQQAYRIAEIAQDCGVDAVAVHPRTAKQGFSGQADWSIITTLKKKIELPVIGNGDVTSAEDAVRMLRTTGCDAVMIGRKAIGSPWIFSQVVNKIRGKPILTQTLDHQFTVMKRYVNTTVAHFGEERACRMLRSRLCWFAKGMQGAGSFRKSLSHLSSQSEALQLIDEYRRVLQVYEDTIKPNVR